MSESTDKAMQLGELDPQALDILSEDGERIASDLERVATVYGFTMLRAQLVEFATKLGVPALTTSIDDEGMPGQVDTWLESPLKQAIESLARLGFELPLDLIERLDEARQSRNRWAHDFWWRAFPSVLSGHTDQVVADLESAMTTLDVLMNDLMSALFLPALENHGVPEKSMVGFSSLLAVILVAQPDLLDGLDLRQDGMEIVERLARLVGIDKAQDVARHGGEDG